MVVVPRHRGKILQRQNQTANIQIQTAGKVRTEIVHSDGHFYFVLCPLSSRVSKGRWKDCLRDAKDRHPPSKTTCRISTIRIEPYPRHEQGNSGRHCQSALL